MTEDDKTETFVTKIQEDKDGNREVTDLTPENYSEEVKALFENTDAIIQEVPQQIEAEKVQEEPVDEDKMFEEKIKESTLIENNSDDNKSKKSNSSNGNEMFSSIQF